MGDRKVYLLDDARLDHYWTEIAKLLQEVPLFKDLYDPVDVYSQLKMGHFQAWALSDGEIRAIVVTTINVFPKAKVFQILAVSGSKFLELWDEADATFDWVARDAGCQYIQAVARKGLGRAKKTGEVEGVLISKKLSSMRIQ